MCSSQTFCFINTKRTNKQKRLSTNNEYRVSKMREEYYCSSDDGSCSTLTSVGNSQVDTMRRTMTTTNNMTAITPPTSTWLIRQREYSTTSTFSRDVDDEFIVDDVNIICSRYRDDEVTTNDDRLVVSATMEISSRISRSTRIRPHRNNKMDSTTTTTGAEQFHFLHDYLSLWMMENNNNLNNTSHSSVTASMKNNKRPISVLTRMAISTGRCQCVLID